MLERIEKLSDEVNDLKEIVLKLSQVQVENPHSFFIRHFGPILTLAGWLVMLGVGYNRFQSLEGMFNKSEMHGSEFAREGIQEIKSEVKVLDARIILLEGEKEKSGAAIQTLLSDMRLVRGWIDEQREKEKISKTAIVPPKL